MRYTYAYKTSDGVRHEDSMNASSREDVFVELRKRGIKAIKVVAADGSKANGETRFIVRKRFVLSALATGLIAGVAVTQFAVHRHGDGVGGDKPVKSSVKLNERLLALQNSAKELLLDHELRMKSSGVSILCDYTAIFTNSSSTAFNQAIRNGYHALNVSRQKMREALRPFYSISPSEDMQERNAAQIIYAEAMEALDQSEARLARSEKAYRLLISNRGKWIVKDGKVIFADDTMALEFKYFMRDGVK